MDQGVRASRTINGHPAASDASSAAVAAYITPRVTSALASCVTWRTRRNDRRRLSCRRIYRGDGGVTTGPERRRKVAKLSSPVNRRSICPGRRSGSPSARPRRHDSLPRSFLLVRQVSQLASAEVTRGVMYVATAAEEASLAAGSMDLVTVAQALHWFDHERFFAEVDRVLRPGRALAVWSYGLVGIEPSIDRDPIPAVMKRLCDAWGNSTHRVVRWPLIVRLARKP